MHEGDDPGGAWPADPGEEVRVSEGNEGVQDKKQGKRPPVRLLLPAAAFEKLSAAGIYCQPRLALAYQRSAQRHVLRAIESGGAVREYGHYVVFCDSKGAPLPWLQPLQSIIPNGPHAVIIAPSMVSVEMFRVEQTYELIIARHQARAGKDGKPPFVFSHAVFAGRHGYLSLELWGRDREAAGEIAPEFFTLSGERHEIPARFSAAVRAATKGVTTLACGKAQFAHAPEIAARPDAAADPPVEKTPLLQVVGG
jgi:hypothetical protein